MSNNASRTAIVVGAGIGGLTAARALAQRGWDVTVAERAPQLTEVGAGIQISPNSVKVLRALGVYEQLAATASFPEALEMRHGRTGRRIFRVDLADTAEARWGAPYLNMARFDVIAALAPPTQGITLRTSATVERYRQDRQSVTVTLDSGEELSADVLIGADGIHSVVRTQMLGSDAPRFTGNVAWRMLVPVERLGDHTPPPTACVWVGGARHAVTFLVRGGTYANLVAVVERSSWSGESWTEQGTRQDALEDFHGWHPTITTLIDQADAHYRWALFDRAPLPRWTDGPVALLGDACHPMLPFQAQGASMAIEDAWTLADQLDVHSDSRQALLAYTRARVGRTSRVQAESTNNAGRFHHGNPLFYAPLQIAARLRPQLLTTRFDWLYKHDVTSPRRP